MDYPVMTPEQLHASALAYLLEGGDEEAADSLAKCRIERIVSNSELSDASAMWEQALNVLVRAPRRIYDRIREEEQNYKFRRSVSSLDIDEGFSVDQRSDLIGRIRCSFEAVLPFEGPPLGRIVFRAFVKDVDRETLHDLIAQTFGHDISNQAPLAREAKFWNELRFRSFSETQIAQALDEAGVLFFPLCRCRVTLGKQRVTREPDFLICHQGKWGILEVDGEPFHPPSRTTDDHTRDRLFRNHWIKVVEHYDAKQCREFPKAVVSQFLRLLEQNG